MPPAPSQTTPTRRTSLPAPLLPGGGDPRALRGNHPGKATAHNVNHALKELRAILEKENISSVALPRLATGVGDLDWDEVEPMIEKHLGDLGIPVMVYVSYEKDKKAAEPV